MTTPSFLPAANTDAAKSSQDQSRAGTPPANPGAAHSGAPAPPPLYSRVRDVTVIMPGSVQTIMRAPLSGMVILSLTNGQVFSFNPQVVKRLARELEPEVKTQSWWRAAWEVLRGFMDLGAR